MNKENMTIEQLAVASQEQFLALEKKIDTVEGKVDLVLSILENISAQTADLKQSAAHDRPGGSHTSRSI